VLELPREKITGLVGARDVTRGVMLEWTTYPPSLPGLTHGCPVQRSLAKNESFESVSSVPSIAANTCGDVETVNFLRVQLINRVSVPLSGSQAERNS